MNNATKIAILFLIFVLPIQGIAVAKISLQQQRDKFIYAEKLLTLDADHLFFKETKLLKDYPLYPYLQYQWMLKNLEQTKQITAFIKKYKKTRYSGLLTYRWQVYLAKNKHYATFLKNYQPTKNTKLQCFYFFAKYKTGLKKEALLGAKKIWVVGKSQPDECDAIFNVLKKSSYFTKELVWKRFRAALSKGNVRLAKYIKRAMSKKDQRIARYWLTIHSNPKKVQYMGQQRQAHLIFEHGIRRLMRRDVAKAIQIWDARKNEFKVDKKRAQNLEKKFAMALALNGDKKAFNRFNQVEKMDEKAKKWRVRAALRSLNWTNVKQAITNLSQESKNKERWKYWLARALEKTGQSKKATSIYSQLAKERSYYGYLSADKLKTKYQLANRPVQVTNKMLNTFKQRTDFKVVSELMELNKLQEAKHQWWYSVKKLNKEEILIAAKYAQELEWKQESIFTIAKAKYWDDVPLRFPMSYQSQVRNNAKLHNLNPALIYGLIRRESAFNENARSPVGARGLMQIMPATGRYIAKQLKEKWRSKKSLFNPETNLKYGSFYYKQLLDQFNGHYALAAAAYNAGPHRVKRWLPSDNRMDADIWVETIPYKETRGYVSAVLTYALIYQKQLKADSLTMDGFMREVLPG